MAYPGDKQFDLNPITLDPAVGNLSIMEIVTNVGTTMFDTIFFVSSAVFVWGAFLYVSSAFREENKNDGKQYMIGSIIGLVIVLASQVILNTVMKFIYSG